MATPPVPSIGRRCQCWACDFALGRSLECAPPQPGLPDERPSLDRRAPVWHDQVLDRILSFPDPTASGRAHRNGAERARLQHQAHDGSGRAQRPRKPLRGATVSTRCRLLSWPTTNAATSSARPNYLHAGAAPFATAACGGCTNWRVHPMLFCMRLPTRDPRPQKRPISPDDRARIEAALLKVAMLVADDPAFTPIFERLEAELDAAAKEERRLSEAQHRARALLPQKAMRAISSAICSSDAPLPYRSRSRR
jgi:hypothetical protein